MSQNVPKCPIRTTCSSTSCMGHCPGSHSSPSREPPGFTWPAWTSARGRAGSPRALTRGPAPSPQHFPSPLPSAFCLPHPAFDFLSHFSHGNPCNQPRTFVHRVRYRSASCPVRRDTRRLVSRVVSRGHRTARTRPRLGSARRHSVCGRPSPGPSDQPNPSRAEEQTSVSRVRPTQPCRRTPDVCIMLGRSTGRIVPQKPRNFAAGASARRSRS